MSATMTAMATTVTATTSRTSTPYMTRKLHIGRQVAKSHGSMDDEDGNGATDYNEDNDGSAATGDDDDSECKCATDNNVDNDGDGRTCDDIGDDDD